jgi:membrane protein
MPAAAADLVQHTMREIVGRQRGWLLVTTLLFAVYSASGAVSGLITALNRAYGVEETRPFWRVKLRAIWVTIVGALATIISLVAVLVGPGLVREIWAFFGLGGTFDHLWGFLRLPIALGAILLTLACLYYFLPNVKQRFRPITPGAVVAVLLWMLASYGFRIYVTHFGAYAKTYGTLGTAIVLLVWLYLCGLTVIFGGEINAMYDRVRVVRPRKNRRRARAA